MAKIITASEAAALVPDGARVMFGGFTEGGAPVCLIDALLERGVRDLICISDDHNRTGQGLSKMVAAGRIKKAIASHVGLNPETGVMVEAGQLELELMPQGTFVERIRAAGAGLGGFLTPTGLGTVVEKGKQKIVVDGREYLLEKPLAAQFALLHARRADHYGNLVFHGTTRNFQTAMATAAETVIVEVEELVDEPLDPDFVHTPGIFVDYLVLCDR